MSKQTYLVVGDVPPGRRSLIAAAFVAMGLSASVSFASNGVEPIAAGTRARARAGADVAVGDTALSQIDNPATLTLSPKIRLDSDVEMGILSTEWRGPVDTAHSTRRVFPLPNGAISVPVTDRLSLGGAFNTKAGFGTKFHMRHLLLPFKRTVNSDLKVVSMPVNAAYKITDRLSFGLGPRLEMATSKFSTVLGPADVEFERGYAYGGGFQTGLHWQARDDLAFGLGYRSPTWANDLHGGRGKATILGLVPVPLGDIAIDELELPQKINMGLAWDVTKRLKLISEVRWINYTHSSLHDLTIATNGPLDLRVPFPMGYKDQWAFIQAAQIALTKRWTWAFGYQYCTEANARANLLPHVSVLPQHSATTGLWYEAEKWWAGGGFVAAFPAEMSGAGYSKIPLGIDYGLSSVREAQYGFSLGFGYRWEKKPKS